MENPATHIPGATRLNSIQTLRFFAAFLVMGAHSKQVLRDDELPKTWDAAASAVGVDVFFVISGFVIAMTAERARSAGGFLLDRILRVLPLYLVLSAVFAAKQVLTGEPPSGTLWVNTLLFLPFIDVGSYDGTLHPYGWSVAYEMWFYGLLAAAIAVAGKSRAAVVCASVLLAGSLIVGLAYRGDWLAPAFAFGPLVWEFAAGCALYLWRDRVTTYAKFAWCLLPVFAVGVALMPYVGYPGEIIGRPLLSAIRAFFWGGFAVCVFTVFYAAEKRIRWPSGLVALGTASYSIYLIQPFVVHVVRAFGGFDPVIRVGLFYAISVVGGWAMYRLVENPLLRLSKAWTRGSRISFFRWREQPLGQTPA